MRQTSRKPFTRRNIARFLFSLAAVTLLSACRPPFAPRVMYALPAVFTQTAAPTPPANAATSVPPTATPSPVPATPTPVGCQETNGRVETRVFETELFPKPITVNLYLPPCYDSAAEKPYPLVVLLHGQSYTHEQWLDLDLPQAADQLISGRQSAPFIVAMPREEYYLQDYLDSKYGSALIQGLLPWLSAEANACGEARCRAIGGISRGAGWAALLAFENPGTFSAVGAHSIPNPPFSDYRLFYLLGLTPEGQVPRVYVDTGKSDRYYSGAQRFARLLEHFEIEHVWLQAEGAHNNEYWAAHMPEYMAWYAAQIAPPQ